MTDPAIKAALEKARDALPRSQQEHGMTIAADVVAAFHRRLAAFTRLAEGAYGEQAAYGHERIAAAVERAAQEARDGE